MEWELLGALEVGADEGSLGDGVAQLLACYGGITKIPVIVANHTPGAAHVDLNSALSLCFSSN